MTEVDDFCKKVIRDVTGKKARGIRPMRAGDYSFNHIGVTSMYMLMSTIPEEIRKEKGFYTVGGCAGNSWAWHTENDTLDVADPEVLLTDIKIYVASIFRILNAYIYPFDFRQWTEEISQGFSRIIRPPEKDLFDLESCPERDSGCFNRPSLTSIRNRKNTYPKKRKKLRVVSGRSISAFLNWAGFLFPRIIPREKDTPMIRLSPSHPFPDLEAIRQFPRLSPERNEYRFLKAQLLRERNKVIDALRRARKEVEKCDEDLKNDLTASPWSKGKEPGGNMERGPMEEKS